MTPQNLKLFTFKVLRKNLDFDLTISRKLCWQVGLEILHILMTLFGSGVGHGGSASFAPRIRKTPLLHVRKAIHLNYTQTSERGERCSPSSPEKQPPTETKIPAALWRER